MVFLPTGDQGPANDHRETGNMCNEFKLQMLDLGDISSIQRLNALPEPKCQY